eukprot:RCo039766
MPHTSPPGFKMGDPSTPAIPSHSSSWRFFPHEGWGICPTLEWGSCVAENSGDEATPDLLTSSWSIDIGPASIVDPLVQTVCSDPSRDALLTLFTKVYGCDLSTWITPHTMPCDGNWVGVLCDATPMVVGLNLYGMGCNGFLSALLHELSPLPLQVLNLSRNGFYGTLDLSLTPGTLQVLSLSQNTRLTGTVDLTVLP